MKIRPIWILLAVIAVDFGVTLIGQPSSYWHDPQTAREANSLFAWFMVRGLAWYLGFILVYMTGVTVLIRKLPRQAAIITGLVFLLSHYFAACTWLTLRFDLGMSGPIIYAVVLSTVLVLSVQSGVMRLCPAEENA
jgi:hypothetical protein